MIYTKKKVESLIKEFYLRSDWSRKRDNGVVLVVAGSYQYTGSPIFNCMSAYRTGSDLVFLVSPRRSADVAANHSPDIITYAREKEFLDSNDVDMILELSKKCNSLLIGGGLTQNPQTKKMILKVIRRCKLPMVIDADALRAIGKNHDVLKNKKYILTPHVDEFFALSGMKVKPDAADRKKKAIDFTKNLSGTLLLKGKDDIIADKGNIFINKSGSKYMTKGGFGDCLAGICAQFLTKLKPFEAAACAAYICGLAGEKIKDQDSSLASDMFRFIPPSIIEIKKK